MMESIGLALIILFAVVGVATVVHIVYDIIKERKKKSNALDWTCGLDGIPLVNFYVYTLRKDGLPDTDWVYVASKRIFVGVEKHDGMFDMLTLEIVEDSWKVVRSNGMASEFILDEMDLYTYY